MEKYISNERIRVSKSNTSYREKPKKELKENQITIQITESTLQWIINKKKFKGISDLTVQLIEDKIVISGATKKLTITINFQIDLRPLVASDRNLSLEIVDMKPLNQNWITKKLLNKPPFISYHKGIIHLDFNYIEKAKMIQFGNLKHFEVRNEVLWIGVGV
ncbi:hypothetical protein [Alkalihalobacterium elongatum]|uniref:hypothetical protein n=1 Tax=Alkalihalobacterium elongatum TaxID=2675466 RepID=UPI001C1FD754|nr:hypothetical protein [Alkalihalobacterium elongatum]